MGKEPERHRPATPAAYELKQRVCSDLEMDFPASGNWGIGEMRPTEFGLPKLKCIYSSLTPFWPGRKQVFRFCGDGGRLAFDTQILEGEKAPGEPLLLPVLRYGKSDSPQ